LAADAEAERARTDAEEARAALGASRTDTKALESALHESRETLRVEMAKASEEAAAAKLEIARVGQVSDALRSNEAKLEKRILEVQGEVEAAKVEERKANKEVERLVTQLRLRSGRLSGELLSVQQMAGQKRTENLHLRRSLNRAEATLKAKVSDLDRATRELEVAKETESAARRQAESAVASGAAAAAERAAALERIAGLSAAHDEALQVSATAKSALAHAEDALSEARRECEAERSAAGRAQEAAGMAALERQQLRTQLDEMKSELVANRTHDRGGHSGGAGCPNPPACGTAAPKQHPEAIAPPDIAMDIRLSSARGGIATSPRAPPVGTASRPAASYKDEYMQVNTVLEEAQEALRRMTAVCDGEPSLLIEPTDGRGVAHSQQQSMEEQPSGGQTTTVGPSGEQIDWELRYHVLAQQFQRYVELTEAELAGEKLSGSPVPCD
jgi:hypothetical protein